MTLDEFKEFAIARGFKLKPACPPTTNEQFNDTRYVFDPYLLKGKHRYVMSEYNDGTTRIYYHFKSYPTKDNKGGWLYVAFADIADLYIEDRRIKGLGTHLDHPLDPPMGELYGDPIQINTF